ncbi:MAG: hypothetical protein GVY08_13425 [Bacteroidetes bacterium]|jgi:hypothetical protein|nr:hypothetical protein [Bacteroidota bacterium]
MKASATRILSVLFFAALFYMAACDNSTNTDLEETLAPYLELEAIEGASNTTLTIQKGEDAGLDSYFAFDVSNVENNGIISEGLVEGWCLEWNKPIDSNNDRHDGIESYSTFGSDTWKPVNYLMSIKDQLKEEDPSLTYREIQVAIWSLIDVPEFNVDEVLAEGNMPSRMMSDGEPNFSVSKVKEIVDHVRTNSDAFTYSGNSPYMVFARTDDDSQNGGFVPCEGDPEQCEGYVSISGSVYVDGNSNEVKNSSESGILNTTVRLTDEEGTGHYIQTDENGMYSFVVQTGDQEKTFTLEVPEQTEETEDFNEGLFDSHFSTTPTTGVTVTASTEDVTGVNFGFEPKVGDLIEKFNTGEIATNTEPRIFWVKQLIIGLASEILGFTIDTEVPNDVLNEHLLDIEDLLLEEPFIFPENKIYSALLIILKDDTDQEQLLSQLLTAELNLVSGRGSATPELDLAIMAFGESAAAEFNGSGAELRAGMTLEENVPVSMSEFDSIRTEEDAKALLSKIIKSNSITTEPMPSTSSVALDDAEPLLRSFNLSGGGGGSVGPAE